MAVPQIVVKELEEAFFLFDYHGDRKITSRELGAVVRSVGLNPTEAELKEMRKEVDAMPQGKVDVQGLMQIISKRIQAQTTTHKELNDAFQVFDKNGNGMVSIQDLRHSLTTLGERLADDELEELVREVDADGEGLVNYEDVVNVLLAK